MLPEAALPDNRLKTQRKHANQTTAIYIARLNNNGAFVDIKTSAAWQATFFCNSQQIKKLNKHFIAKSVDSDDIPVGYHPLKWNKNMDIIINELSKSLNSREKSNETVNDIVAGLNIIFLKDRANYPIETLSYRTR